MAILQKNRILLVHPLGYRVERSGQDVSRIANIMPPLGLASLAAYLEKENIKADIVDYFAKPFSDGTIQDYLARETSCFYRIQLHHLELSGWGPHCQNGEKGFTGHKNGFWGPPCFRPENKKPGRFSGG